MLSRTIPIPNMDRALTLLVFSFLLCILGSHTLSFPSPNGMIGSNRTTPDEFALLSFKSTLSKGSLLSWRASRSYCSWPGVVCGGRRHPARVVALRLPSRKLSGRLSPSLGNLSFLRELNLGNNYLVGQIPPELGRLVKLRLLNLSENSLQGSIPVALRRCTCLMTLDLSSNQLQGEILNVIDDSLKNLVLLRLSRNILSGEIPRELGNLTNLVRLSLVENMLSGVIPSSLGRLSNLSYLNLSYNNLSGTIPASVWNISSLITFAVYGNMLSGTIPGNIFSNLHLQVIAMDTNRFHGQIPASIANASDLSFIRLSDNFFSGIVPPEVRRLRNLTWLQISVNLLQAKEPKDWDFITSLTNCSQLQNLGLGENKFEGALPDSVSNLSTSLIHFVLEDNKISGSIPRDIGNLVNLQGLILTFNSFTGTLPSSLIQIRNMGRLTVSENKLSGSVPLTIGNLTKLNYLWLGSNAFSGRIPSTLGNLTNLLALDLSGNKFTGPVPSELFNIPTLSRFFNLSHNNLEGEIPLEIGNLQNLVEFRAESNKLSGEIPVTIAECQLLRNLYLQNNILTGRIPSSLSQLKGLENLDLSSNNLSGQIPMFLGNISMLSYLNLSFNRFAGEVPNFGVFANATAISIQGNDKLCGGIPDLHLPPCSSQVAKKSSLVIPIVVPLAATIVILSLICIYLCWRKRTTRTLSTTSVQGHPFISYSQLARATGGFSTANLLGSGAFGTVFRANIGNQDGESTSPVAVKVLKLQTPGALKSFVVECEALRNLRHRNLIKVVTACSSIDNRGNDFKAIVFEFMPNGSLEDWLHPDTNDQTVKYLNLLERVNILLDVAHALDYLHCHGHAPVLHCDLKPSNVLLDAEMVAHVGDFGLAKILVETSSYFQHPTSSMGFRGTIGYAPPEYGAGNMVSTYGDIYSYGILVLETVTGKRPTDSKFIEGLSIRQYAELGLGGIVMDVVDTELSLNLKDEFQTADDSSCKLKIDCLISLLRLGLSCSQEMPASRMATGDIIKELIAMKEPLLLWGNQNLMKQDFCISMLRYP